MKTLLERMVLVVFFITFLTSSILASELEFGFKNPAFSGDGYSSHVLSVDQLQEQRKTRLKMTQNQPKRQLKEQRKIKR